jgi:DNA-3-methyladenine glycosylase II
LIAAEAWAHLRGADPVLARLLDERGEPVPRRDPLGDHYGALVRAIIGQQVSVRAAASMFERLREQFGGREPTPEEILAADPDVLRPAAGLSRAKMAFLRSLAEHVVSGDLDLGALDAMPDDEVIAALTAVKGIGEWTVHVFLIFQLHRPDVLAVGDLGVRRAVERAYGLPDLPSTAELTALAERWRPYRTAACLLLWDSLYAAPVAGA